MSYSVDCRRQVFMIKQKEYLTFQETRDRLIRTLFRWQIKLDPQTKRNKPSTKVDMEVLRKHVEENPDTTNMSELKNLEWVRVRYFML